MLVTSITLAFGAPITVTNLLPRGTPHSTQGRRPSREEPRHLAMLTEYLGLTLSRTFGILGEAVRGSRSPT